jgi:hypothetical protein
MKFNRQAFVSAMLLTSCFASHAPALAQVPQSSHVKAADVEAKQRQWRRCIDPLQQATERRIQEANAYHHRIRGVALDCYGDEGVEAFLQDAISVTAKTKALTETETAWKAWIREQFLKDVFPAEEFKRNVLAQTQRLEKDFTAIDDEALVELELDVELTLAPLTSPAFTELDRAVEEAVAMIAPDVRQANIEDAERAAGKLVVGTIAGERYSDAMRDDEGNRTWSGFLGGLLVGWAAEEAADAIVESASSTMEDLRICVGLGGTNVALACADCSKPAAQQRVAYVGGLLKRHEIAIADAVIADIGVDRQWAVDAYNARAREKYESQK